MEAVLPLKQMSIEEKLRAMEIIWDDLCQHAGNILSPSWHKNILEEREQQIKNGEDDFMDWNNVKKEIQDSIS